MAINRAQKEATTATGKRVSEISKKETSRNEAKIPVMTPTY